MSVLDLNDKWKNINSHAEFDIGLMLFFRDGMSNDFLIRFSQY